MTGKYYDNILFFIVLTEIKVTAIPFECTPFGMIFLTFTVSH
jgi:hypothetical protein